jgi:hypothetical protein
VRLSVALSAVRAAAQSSNTDCRAATQSVSRAEQQHKAAQWTPHTVQPQQQYGLRHQQLKALALSRHQSRRRSQHNSCSGSYVLPKQLRCAMECGTPCFGALL